MRRLRVGDAFLHALDLLFDVTVGHEDVEPAVQIVVEEKASEAEREQTRAAHLRARRFVHEQSIAFVVVESQHLIREVADEHAGAAGTVVIGSVHAHAGAGHAVFAEGHAGQHAGLGKSAVPVVVVELVGLRIVGDQQVGPAILVVVEHAHAKSLRSRVQQPGFSRDVFKGTVAAVVPQPDRRALVRFRRAVGLCCAVERAVDVGLGRPLHVVRYH